eukprot:COSAG04_NODE_2301_length_4364_cov_1.731770_1_plen_150_part_00
MEESLAALRVRQRGLRWPSFYRGRSNPVRRAASALAGECSHGGAKRLRSELTAAPFDSRSTKGLQKRKEQRLAAAARALLGGRQKHHALRLARRLAGLARAVARPLRRLTTPAAALPPSQARDENQRSVFRGRQNSRTGRSQVLDSSIS